MLQIPEIRYRTRKYTTQLPAVIECAGKGEIVYKVRAIRDISWNTEGYHEVGFAHFDITWFGQAFSLILDGPETRVEGNAPKLDHSEYEGIGGHLLASFLVEMDIA